MSGDSLTHTDLTAMRRVLLATFFIILSLSFVPMAQAAHIPICDNPGGTLDTTCEVSTAKGGMEGHTLSGTGSLIIKGTGSLSGAGGPGTTLTITLGGDLTIETGGVISANVDITASNLTFQGGGTITAAGRGFGPQNGPGAGGSSSGGGGGGHGGQGGGGGIAYDDPVNPTQLGSGGDWGGGRGACNVPGGSGGGLVSISVSSTLTLNGNITANGGAGNPPGHQECAGRPGSGGGSGGSVKIMAGVVSGTTGQVSADGGNSPGAGGGGGGRIAVICTSCSIPSTISRSAIGGAGGSGGGAGTIYLKNQNQTYGVLVVDNGADLTPTPTPLTAPGFTFDNLTISKASVFFSGDLTITALTLNLDAGGGSLRLAGSLSGPTTLTLTNISMTASALATPMASLLVGTSARLTMTSGATLNATDVTIAASGSLSADTQGSGAAFSDYSDFKTPTTSGGAGGGGVLRLSTGTLTVNGALTATGTTGGSIYVTTATLAGSGSINANGSNGGKVAISYTTSNTFSGITTTYGSAGPAGTIFIVSPTSQPNGTLIISNGSTVAGGTTNLGTFTPGLTLDSLTLLRAHVALTGNLIVTAAALNLDAGGGSLSVTGNFSGPTSLAITNMSIGVNSLATTDLTLSNGSLSVSVLNVIRNLTVSNGNASMSVLNVSGNFTVGPNFTLNHPAGDPAGLSIMAANMTLDPMSSITADALGFTSTHGPGGVSSSSGGAGYGGAGGAGGGAAYGDPLNPSNIGSGGAYSSGPGSCARPGGTGGGLISISLSGTFTLNGSISTNGSVGESACGGGSGGGSGGSVKIMTGVLSGTTGQVSANGGNSPGGGGGGGGRIAVRYGQATFPGLLRVRGGTGGDNGEAGTICFINLTTNTTTCHGPGGSGEATFPTAQPPVAGPVMSTPSFSSFVGSPFTLTTDFTDSTNPVTSCEYTTDGTTFAPATVSGAGPTYTCTQTGLIGANGAVLTLTMRATSAGGTGVAPAITRTVDTAPPTTTDNALASWQRTDVTMTLTATDGTGSGVALISFCTDPTNTCTPATVGTSVSVTCPAATACLTSVRYQSTDNLGTLEAVRSVPVRIDKVVPTGAVTINGGALFTTTPTVALALTCTDMDAGCAEMRIAPDGTVDTEPSVPLTPTATTTLPGPDGMKTVAVIFHDAAGNLSPPAPATITLDTTPPEVSITTNPLGPLVTGNVTITATASDATSGVAQVDFAVTDPLTGVTTFLGTVAAPGPYTVLWNTTPYPDGPYTLTATARDVATNARSASVDVTVDNKPLTVRNVGADPLTFNPSFGEVTALSYDLSEPATVTVKIVDSTTLALVSEVLTAQPQGAGVRQVLWNGTNTAGALVQGRFLFDVIATDQFGTTVTASGPGGNKTLDTVFDQPVIAMVQDTPDRPISLSLNETSTISFTLRAIQPTLRVSLTIADATGTLVSTLLANQPLSASPAGDPHSVIWDGTDTAGALVAPGAYRYTLTARVPMTGIFANPQTGAITVTTTRVTVSPDGRLTVFSHPAGVGLTLDQNPPLSPEQALALLARGSTVAGAVYQVTAHSPLQAPAIIQFRYDATLRGQALIPVRFDLTTQRWAPVRFVLDAAHHQLLLQTDALGLLALLSNGDTTPPQIGSLLVTPQTLRFTLTDHETGVDREGLTVILNGQDLTPTLLIRPVPGTATLEVEQPFHAQALTTNTLVITAYDIAGNLTRRTVTFDTAFADVTLTLTPEVLKVNHGTLTATLRFPKELPVTHIETATLDGALVDRIVGAKDADRDDHEQDGDDDTRKPEKDKARKKFTLKFRRTAIEHALDRAGEVLDTAFLLQGTAQGNLGRVTFEGRDTIRKIQ